MILKRLHDESDSDYEKRCKKAEDDRARFLEKNRVKNGGDYRKLQLDLDVLETGILKFDMACGWLSPVSGLCGIRKGDMFEICGQSATGKTAVADQMTLTTLRRYGPQSVVWICSEQFEPQRFILKGIDPEDVIVRTADDPDYEIRKNLGEDLMEFALKMCEQEWVHLIIIDSVAALTTNRLLYDGKGENAWRDVEVTPVANLGSAFNNFCFQFSRRRKNCVLGMVNHWSPPIETGFTLNEDTVTPGGAKKQFLSNVRVRAAGVLDIDRDQHSVEGYKSSNTLKTRFEFFKNKYCNPTNHRKVKVEYDFLTQRYNNEEALIEYASFFGTRVPNPDNKKEKITVSKIDPPVAKIGAWTYIGNESFNGIDRAVQYLIDNPDIYDKIKLQLYQYRNEFWLDQAPTVESLMDG